MANLDSLYDKVLNEAWSKTIAGNGKNTLLVHTEAEFKPEEENTTTNTTTNTPADPELLKDIKYNPADYTNLDPDELAALQAEEKLRKEQMEKDIEADLLNTNQDRF